MRVSWAVLRIHIHKHTYIHTHTIYVFTYIHICVNIHTCIHVYMLWRENGHGPVRVSWAVPRREASCSPSHTLSSSIHTPPPLKSKTSAHFKPSQASTESMWSGSEAPRLQHHTLHSQFSMHLSPPRQSLTKKGRIGRLRGDTRSLEQEATGVATQMQHPNTCLPRLKGTCSSPPPISYTPSARNHSGSWVLEKAKVSHRASFFVQRTGGTHECC